MSLHPLRPNVQLAILTVVLLRREAVWTERFLHDPDALVLNPVLVLVQHPRPVPSLQRSNEVLERDHLRHEATGVLLFAVNDREALGPELIRDEVVAGQEHRAKTKLVVGLHGSLGIVLLEAH